MESAEHDERTALASSLRRLHGEIVPPNHYLLIDDGAGRVLGRAGALDAVEVRR